MKYLYMRKEKLLSGLKKKKGLLFPWDVLCKLHGNPKAKIYNRDTKHKKGDWENDKFTKVGRNRGKRNNRDKIQAEGK